MAAVVAAHPTTVRAVYQAGLCPGTGNVVEEDGPSCGLIHREGLCDHWSCREEVRKGVKLKGFHSIHNACQKLLQMHDCGLCLQTLLTPFEHEYLKAFKPLQDKEERETNESELDMPQWKNEKLTKQM